MDNYRSSTENFDSEIVTKIIINKKKSSIFVWIELESVTFISPPPRAVYKAPVNVGINVSVEMLIPLLIYFLFIPPRKCFILYAENILKQFLPSYREDHSFLTSDLKKRAVYFF